MKKYLTFNLPPAWPPLALPKACRRATLALALRAGALLTIAICFSILSNRAIALEKVQPHVKQMIRVSPVILKVKLDPGTKQNYQVKIENLLDAPLPLRASVEGFDASDEEYGITISEENIASPLMDWISLSDQDAILPAKTAKDFTIQITVPDKVPLGGYYAMIFFTPIFPGVPVSSKIGVLALANIGVQDQKNKAEIVTFDFDHKIYERGPIGATIRIKNTSLNYFSAKPALTIKPLFGEEQTFELEEKTILPGKIRRWQRAFDIPNLYGGIYTATLAVSLENGDYIYSTTHFVGFPVTKAVLIILGTLSSIYILLNRKKVSKALKILIRG